MTLQPVVQQPILGWLQCRSQSAVLLWSTLLQLRQFLWDCPSQRWHQTTEIRFESKQGRFRLLLRHSDMLGLCVNIVYYDELC